ncbi:uncharacterized protein DFL_007452 [Arthrobotrys flagrans]|uniref:Uncharacterized protein n=1 Tax=Arthrobotrys flagrans TaxID=97331 RepID=A0A436ZVU4_ARTFL|nr:hypothetical protein DFL_007452 [Arthrobotrys flagrans]
MSQTFLPPQIHILAYKTIAINPQASALDGVPLICGVFVYINDPPSDQSDAIGIKCSLKDVPPSIMEPASDQMQRVQQSEKDSRVKWVTGDRVYVKELTFTFGMVKIVDPDIGMLGSLPLPVGSITHGVAGVGGGRCCERSQCGSQRRSFITCPEFGACRRTESRCSSKNFTDGAFVQTKIKCEDQATCTINKANPGE